MAETKCGFNDIPGGASGSLLLVTNGPTLLVNIGFDKNWTLVSGKAPVSSMPNLYALVDTGATESCIDNLLASQLNLPIIDRRQIAGAAGKQTVNMYLAQIYVPALGFTVHGAFAGVDLKAGGQNHNALIGRTFLQKFIMVYDGIAGTVTIKN